MDNYIKLNRSILEWEWYRDIAVKMLFIHLLLKANWKDGSFQGRIIPRGSLVTSIPHLVTETGLTIQQVRTALDKLKKTQSISIQTTNKFSIIEVLHYSDFQDEEQAVVTGKQQADNKQEKPKKEPKPRAKFVAPTVEEVAEYCKERGNGVDANKFVAYYESKGWLVGKSPMKDWKAAVRTWENNSWNKPKTTGGKPSINDKVTAESEEAIMEAFLK